MAKNVLGWTVGSGSLDRTVSSGGGGGGSFFGFGGAGATTGIGFAAGAWPLAGMLSPAAGTVPPVVVGMNGGGGAAGGGLAAGETLGAAALAGAPAVCAGAPAAKNGALSSAPASRIPIFIQPNPTALNRPISWGDLLPD